MLINTMSDVYVINLIMKYVINTPSVMKYAGVCHI